MYNSILILILLIFGYFQLGSTQIRCFDCTSEITHQHYDYDACFYGDERYLPSVICREESVCAAYHYQTEIPGSITKWSVSRGCQAIRYGATCEDIFNDLRRTGSVLPGLHTCTTCSEDLCNKATPSISNNNNILLLIILLGYVLFRNV